MSLIASTPAAEEPAMIVPQIPAYTIALTESSLAEKRAAIETLQEVVAVESVKDRDDAIAALALAKGNLKHFLQSKDDLKEPALKICQQIDELARGYANPIKIEQTRVEKLVNEYQAKCNAAAEALRREEIAAIAHENAIAAAQNNIERLRENAAREAELNQPVKVEGAMMKQFLDFDVIDYKEAFLANPTLFRIEPKRAEILAKINAPGFVSMPGIVTRLTTKLHAKAS